MTYREQIEQHLDSFPEMPPMCQNLLGYLDDPEVDFTTIKDIIQFDPGLTANVLKMANSVHFAAARPINSLQTALARLGTKSIFELILSLTISSRLLDSLPGYGLRANDLLRHSIWTAVASQELGSILGMQHTGMIFTIGLLHDLGLLLLDPFIKTERLSFNNAFEKQEKSFDQAERDILGMDHAEAGARILARWQLGPEVVAGVRWHHQPDQASEYEEIIYLIHLADMLSLSEGIGTGMYGLQFAVSPETVKTLGLRKKHLESAASTTLDKMRELESILT